MKNSIKITLYFSLILIFTVLSIDCQDAEEELLILTLSELYDYENIDSVQCYEPLPDEGDRFGIYASIYEANVNRSSNSLIIYNDNTRNDKNLVFEDGIIQGYVVDHQDKIFSKIENLFVDDSADNEWASLTVYGEIYGFDMPSNSFCNKGIMIYIDEIEVP